VKVAFWSFARLARVVALGGLVGLLSQCSSGSDRSALPRISDQPGPGVIPDACATPNEGCQCDEPDEAVACGVAARRVGDYVWCAEGTRVCGGEGTWGECLDTKTVRRRVSTLRPQTLGSSESCAEENPCDPFCNDFDDDGTDVTDPDGDVVVTPDGITLVESVPPTSSPCVALAITPTPSTLTITALDPLGPTNTRQFTPVLSEAGCFVGTPEILWGLDRYDIATISDTGLVTVFAPIAGPITVSAHIGNLSATARLNIVVNVTETTPGVPTGLVNAMESTANTDELTLLYPYADTVFPLGLLPPLLQWEAPQAATAVKVSLRYPSSGPALFRWARVGEEGETLPLDPPNETIVLPEGQRRAFPIEVWRAFEQTVNRNRTVSGDRGEFVIQRFAGGTVRSAIERPVRFAEEPLRSSIYYRSYGTRLVENWGPTYAEQTIGGGARFGAATLALTPGASSPTVAAGHDSATNGSGCRACHAVSADPSVLVTNMHMADAPTEPGQTGSTLFRVGSDPPNAGSPFTMPSPTNGLFSWPAIFPNGRFMLTNAGPSRDFRGSPLPGGLDGSAGSVDHRLYSLQEGMQGMELPLAGFPAGLRAAMPAFAPDGVHVVFNHWQGDLSGVPGDGHSLGVGHFDVELMTFYSFGRFTNNAGACSSTSFGGIVSTERCTDVWPSFVPDDVGAVFAREVFGNGSVPREVNGAEAIRYSDFGGTRAGCSGADPSLHCGNQGTRSELWWVAETAAAQTAPLRNANGRNPDDTLYIPTRTHGGDADGICETGEACMENNPASDGNDDWICDAGETCQEYNQLCAELDSDGVGDDDALCEPGEVCLENNFAVGGDNDRVWEPEAGESCWLRNFPCREWDTGEGAADGNNDNVCDPGELCVEENGAVGGDEDGRWEENETCAVNPSRQNNVCDPGEICAEALANHIASDEPVLNYEPAVNPTPAGGYYWTAFTSRRMYGNVATMNPWWSDPRDRPIGGQYGPPTKKIWVTALDLNPGAGTDPSHPPFYLPGQEYLAANSKPVWVRDECTRASSTRSDATTCRGDLDCCLGGVDSTCSLDASSVASGNPVRHCIPSFAEDCIADDSPTQCSSDAQCCGSDSVCASGVCRVPPRILGYGAGEFVRTFESECEPGAHPVWRLFEWRADVPAGTQIVFDAQSAQTIADLEEAEFVEIGRATPDNSNLMDFTASEDEVDAILRAATKQDDPEYDGERSLEYLRITMRLTPSEDRLAAPTLRDWHLVYDCLDAE
jgi:hypothetical protein